MHVHYMTTHQHKNPCLGGDQIYNFSRLLCGNYYYTLSFLVLCLGEEKNMFKEIMHFQYITYKDTPQHMNPCPGGFEIYNFGRPFPLVIITIQLVCIDHATE